MILFLLIFLFLAKHIIIYSFRIYYFIKQIYSSKNFSVIRKISGKDNLAITSLIVSNPLRLVSSDSNPSNSLSNTSSDSNLHDSLNDTSSESDSSGTLSVDELETSTSDTLSVISSESDILSFNAETYYHYISPDSLTILNQQTFEQ
jgi:hypothetical protein